MFTLARMLLRLVSSLLSLILLVLLGTAGFVYYESKQQELLPSDAIVVLGAAQFNGTPSPVLANRLDHALDLFANDVAPLVITVGGKQPGDRYTEASAGRSYLIDGGLASNQVVALPTGSDTLTSLNAVTKYANKHELVRLTVVSDPAHVARVKILLQDAGFLVRVAPTETGPGAEMTPDYLIRETGGLLDYWLVRKWTA